MPMSIRSKLGWQAWIVLYTALLLGFGPSGTRPGCQLEEPQVSAFITDWSFVSDVEEIALETTAPWGRYSVTVWCVIVEGRLYLATDDRKEKRWVRHLDRNPDARVGINGRVYPVRAESLTGSEPWRAVMEGYARKYGDEFLKHDFPVPDDLSSGRIFELKSPSLPENTLTLFLNAAPARRPEPRRVRV